MSDKSGRKLIDKWQFSKAAVLMWYVYWGYLVGKRTFPLGSLFLRSSFEKSFLYVFYIFAARCVRPSL